jgi:16S rRNA (uracil1498-N3)-methyltransferase
VHRFFYPALPPSPAGEIDIGGPEAHHMIRVRRLGEGDRVLLFDGTGREAEAEIVAVGRRAVRLALRAPGGAGRELSTRVVLGVAPPKGKRMQILVEKATELGVAAIFPLVAARTVVLPRAREEAKIEKWRKTTIEAAKQSGRGRLPDLLPAQSFDEALAIEAARRLILDPGPRARPIRELFAAGAPSVLLLVGPEGGFTAEEVERAIAAGFEAACLAPTILRVETAAIAALAAIAAILG